MFIRDRLWDKMYTNQEFSLLISLLNHQSDTNMSISWFSLSFECGYQPIESFLFLTNSRRWRIFADVSVDIGITLEVVATLFPKPLFLPCICVGNMFKVREKSLIFSSIMFSQHINSNKYGNTLVVQRRILIVDVSYTMPSLLIKSWLGGLWGRSRSMWRINQSALGNGVGYFRYKR